MLTAFIFSLVVGGGLLTLTLFGDLFGGDVDAEADIGMDADADALSGGSEIAKLLSLRSLVYALFGFGGSGLLLVWAGTPPMLSALIAAGMGLGCGALVSTVFGYLKRTEAGAIPGERALVGLSGKIVMAIGEGETGAVRIRSGERRYEMRARADLPPGAAQTLEAGSAVVVVDVTEGVALVTPVDTKLLEE